MQQLKNSSKSMYTARRNERRCAGAVLKAAVVIGVLAATALAACDLPVGEVRENPEDRGALRVSIQQAGSETAGGLGALAASSGVDMEPAAYRISGSGPSDASFETWSNGGTKDIGDLRTGEWLVAVSAFNADEHEIGYGSETVEISGAELATVSIVVRALSGTGSLSLSVIWDGEELAEPSIAAQLIAPAGESRELEFEITAPGAAEFSGSEIDSGYYTLILQLLDGGEIVAGAADTVRIVKDGHTEGAFSFEDLNHPTGEVDISVISDLDDPLEVEINAEHTTIARGESMTADAWVENAGDAEIEYNWYLNGAPAGTNASVSVGADLSPGSYRLDIVVRTADGRRSGSATHSFTVE